MIVMNLKTDCLIVYRDARIQKNGENRLTIRQETYIINHVNGTYFNRINQ